MSKRSKFQASYHDFVIHVYTEAGKAGWETEDPLTGKKYGAWVLVTVEPELIRGMHTGIMLQHQWQETIDKVIEKRLLA